MINLKYKTIERPNGNLTVYEYLHGKLNNKIVQKGDKHFVTTFMPDGKRMATLVYESKPKVVLQTKGGLIDITNNKTKFIPAESSVSFLNKIIFSLTPEKIRDKKIIKKSDGKEYFRLLKPVDYNPKTNFMHKMLDKALSIFNTAIKLEYTKELLIRGKKHTPYYSK